MDSIAITTCLSCIIARYRASIVADLWLSIVACRSIATEALRVVLDPRAIKACVGTLSYAFLDVVHIIDTLRKCSLIDIVLEATNISRAILGCPGQSSSR